MLGEVGDLLISAGTDLSTQVTCLFLTFGHLVTEPALFSAPDSLPKGLLKGVYFWCCFETGVVFETHKGLFEGHTSEGD